MVATRLARAAGCADTEVGDVLYTALLQHLGCTAYSHESARVGGRPRLDAAGVPDRLLGSERRVAHVRLGGRGLDRDAQAEGAGHHGYRGQAVLHRGPRGDLRGGPGRGPAARPPASAQDGLFHGMTMWNGRGVPAAAGQAIPLSCRIMQVAATAVLFAVHAGAEAAVSEMRRRAGSYLDPDLAGVFVDRAGELLADLDHVDAYECVLGSEPDPVRLVDDEESEALARTFGHLVDLKSPNLHGHSAGVGDLAAAGAQKLGLHEQARTVRIAGYLHDLGPGRRLQPHLGQAGAVERRRARPGPAAPVLQRAGPRPGPPAGRGGDSWPATSRALDGSGYHRGAMAAQLSTCSRGSSPPPTPTGPGRRPPAPARVSTEPAAERLRAEARAGRLDGETLAGCSGSRPRTGTRRARPSGLTQRQVEVLRLLARKACPTGTSRGRW